MDSNSLSLLHVIVFCASIGHWLNGVGIQHFIYAHNGRQRNQVKPYLADGAAANDS